MTEAIGHVNSTTRDSSQELCGSLFWTNEQDATDSKMPFRCITWYHIHEELTISVIETWGYLSGTKCNPDNPNRYWNREDEVKFMENLPISPLPVKTCTKCLNFLVLALPG